MDEDERLAFPDQRRSELEHTIEELLDRAQSVLTAQGRLRSLLHASKMVVEELDLTQVLQHIVEAAIVLVDAEYGALGVVDQDGRLEQFIHVGMAEEVVSAIGHLPEGHGILGAVIESESPIRLENLGADPRSEGFPDHHPPMHTFLGVPIRVRGVIFGHLYLTNRRGGVFTEEDEVLISALASTAAIAIDNARRYEESLRLERISTALAEITAALLASDVEDVFGVVAERVASLVKADLVCIVMPARDSEQYRVETARGLGAAAIEGIDIAANQMPVSEVMHGASVAHSNGFANLLPDEEKFSGPWTTAVPLLMEGEPAGALCVTRRPRALRFSDADLSTLSEFAAQAGLALAIAQARADRQRLDLIDERARIARALHDNVIQRLFGTGLGMQALATTLPSHSAAILAHVDEIDAAIADIRTSIFALQTSSADSIRHRVLDIVTELGGSLLSAPHVAFAGPVDLLVTGSLADDVVAVVRESLSNVAQHARATTADIDLVVTSSHLTLVVDDDGKGMPNRPARTSGTKNLADRARARGGVCSIERRPTGGTRLRWHVPLEPTAERTA